MPARKRSPASKPARFTTPLIEGHGGVTPVIVPFDPEAVWDRKPVTIDPRRDGWLVEGTMNGAPFAGWIGHRWGRFFIILDPALRTAAGVAVGDSVEVVVRPTDSAAAMAVAREQARLTTARGRGRASRTPRPARTVRRKR